MATPFWLSEDKFWRSARGSLHKVDSFTPSTGRERRLTTSKLLTLIYRLGTGTLGLALDWGTLASSPDGFRQSWRARRCHRWPNTSSYDPTAPDSWSPSCLLFATTAGRDRGVLQVFLGDQSVGKTSIITRFMYDKFDNTYQVWGGCFSPSQAKLCLAHSSTCCRPLSALTSCPRPCTWRTALSGCSSGEQPALGAQ